MPLDGAYLKMMESTVADLKNAGKRSAGSCTAAIFLKEFVSTDAPWIHLDIAGVMHSDATRGYLSRGMTGVPTRTLLRTVLEHSKQKCSPKEKPKKEEKSDSEESVGEENV